MKVLIIGGTGLISTAITRQLLERGDEVTIYTRGKRPLPAGSRVRQIIGDRTDYPAFEARLRAEDPFECVIDMVGYEPEDAAAAVRTFAGRAGHYIFCSTVDVYAKPAPSYPVREDAPRRAITDYGKKKVICEDIVLGADRRGDLPVSVLRCTYTYGEGARGIIHSLGFSTTFLDRLRRGHPVIVQGNGTGLWNPCHIDDVARGFLGATMNVSAFGRAYNVTGEEAITWDQLTATVAEALGARPPEIVHIPTDLLARVVPERAQLSLENIQYPNVHDTAAARADLGFRYTIPVLDGMRRTVAWFAANGLIEDSDRDPEYDAVIAAWRRLSEHMEHEFAEGGAKR
jgi:nucleoside-diphosphate-sugar epimerase